MGTLEAIIYKDNRLRVLNQLALPHVTTYDDVVTLQDGWSAIREMRVRGAPAIAIVAALTLVVELKSRVFASLPELQGFVTDSWEYLKTSRPTAVNLFEVARRVANQALQFPADTTVATAQQGLIAEMEAMLDRDIADNQAIGRWGAEAILRATEPATTTVRILTHCNTGSLATAGFGTALGVIRAVHAAGRLDHAFCTETRPYNQGARLTAYELVYEKIPASLITDSMAAALMQQKGIHAVVVGADRVVANGDTANKIGTYQLAIVAKYHKVPFYVAAPLTSIDLSRTDGGEIVIEERPPDELTHVNGQRIAASGIGVWNPAFDVTPARLGLITGIITELGVITKPAAAEHFDVVGFVQAAQKRVA